MTWTPHNRDRVNTYFMAMDFTNAFSFRSDGCFVELKGYPIHKNSILL